MLQPFTSETEWAVLLESVCTWSPPAYRTVLISPHPDDEVLGAGGLLASQARRGVEVMVAAVTDGERAYPNVDNLAEIRRFEQQAALAALGVPHTHLYQLSLPDTRVSDHEDEVVERLLPLVDRNTLLLSPWIGDRHPDHVACGRAGLSLAAATGAMHASYFFWAWHHCGTAELLETSPCRFDLDLDLQAKKLAALAQHRSQLVRESGDAVLPRELLAPAKRSFENFILHDA